MKETPYILDFKEDDEPIAFRELVVKYLKHWPWFLVSCVLFLALGYAYEKYAPKIYTTEAKIKILDNSQEAKVIPKDVPIGNQNLKLNLENHIEVLKSNQLLNKVVNELDLDVSYYEFRNFSFQSIAHSPFVVTKSIKEDQLEKPLAFEIRLSTAGYHITDETGKKFVVPYEVSAASLKDILPFTISISETMNVLMFKDKKYKVVLHPKRHAAAYLAEDLKIATSEKQSDVLTLSIKGQSTNLSESILNTIVKNFDDDGIKDKQLITRRTLEIVDARFNSLSQELDSIEAGKEGYKIAEDLSYIQTDAGASLQRKSETETELLKLETQISLLGLLDRTVSNEAEYNLLPADIGLANSALNAMVEKYNELARERQKLGSSLQPGHPKLVNLSERLEFSKQNILSTVKVYKSQLAISRRQLDKQKNKADLSYAELPEKERVLRSIERQQAIKENLYLLLLKKREEAAIDYASTSSSVKVIDYAISSIKPFWPKKALVYPLFLALGLMLPFMFVLLRSSFDTKLHDRAEIERLNPEIPTLIEIPLFKAEKSFAKVPVGSSLSEAFRILSVNTDHLLGMQETDIGKVICVTSAIKREGKTLLATNLSLAYASMGKRVLLVGADLRNPQVHSYTALDKNVPGLSNYLKDQWFSFYDGIQSGFENYPSHNIYLSGKIPNSAPALLSHKRFAEFIDKAKQEYDYVILDTAPTMLVTDTLLISKYADATLFVVRSGLTDKKLLQFSKELFKNKKLKNMAYVLNGVGKTKNGNYNYGYAYGYDNHEYSS
ncbi:GumC family protein [Maribacter chungangensis]|uniref:non-specific protein-tyrosine kinase n=1 Tax=Maribacter chungangensis TaxID=1069117 RepID=A0ABW3B1E0_9FLAO